MQSSRLKTEQEAWEEIYGPQGARLQEEFDTEFLRLFPKGHEGSLSNLVRIFGSLVLSGKYKKKKRLVHLEQIHPDAFELIATYGIDYVASAQKEPMPEPKRGQCFTNSWIMMEGWHKVHESGMELSRAGPPLYVEGIVVGVEVLPMLHAWNVFGVGHAQAEDWTFYSICKWNRYIGIPINREEYRAIFGSRQNALFTKEAFPHTRDKLLEILSRRK